MNHIAKPKAKSSGVDWSFKEPNHYARKLYFSKKQRKKLKRLAKKRKVVKKLSSKEMADKAFFESRAWQELRYQALLLHGKKCQCCGAVPPAVILHVDHIKPRARFKALELCLDNLQVLCADCNLGKGMWDQTDHRPKKVTFRDGENDTEPEQPRTA